MNFVKSTLLSAGLVLAVANVCAQSIIKVVPEPYVQPTPLPLGPGDVQSALGPSNATIAASLPKPAPVWVAKGHHGTVRQVLDTWSKAAGWTFAPEHWTVNRDFPITGELKVQGDFAAAVRELLASTELTDFPVQPCFYSNSVLRVVLVTEKCDRTVSAPN